MAPHNITPPFVRPPFSLTSSNVPPPNGFNNIHSSKIRTILDLVDLNATHNAEHTFCLQQLKNEPDLVPITFQRLLNLIDSVAVWLCENGIVEPQGNVYGEGNMEKPAPVALLMGSDISILTHMLALMKLGIPVSIPLVLASSN